MSVYRLDDELFDFPPAEEADHEYDGLLAVGGDYSPERLLNAYSNGIFPWPVAEGRPITWFSPDPRFVLMAEDFRILKSLKKTLMSGFYGSSGTFRSKGYSANGVLAFVVRGLSQLLTSV